jgi:hypothetical protein
LAYSSGFSRETEPTGYIEIHRKRLIVKNWLMGILDAERAHDLWSASGRSRKAFGTVPF